MSASDDEYESVMSGAATPEEAEEDYQATMGGMQGELSDAQLESVAAPKKGPWEGGGAALEGVLQGGSLGMFRKAVAALESKFTGQPYEEALAETEKALGGLQSRNPVSHGIGEAVGEGLLLGSSWSKAPLKAAERLAARAAAQQGAVRGAAQLAGTGKLAATAGGRELVESGDLGRAAGAAAIGAGAGLAGAGIARGGEKLLRPNVVAGGVKETTHVARDPMTGEVLLEEAFEVVPDVVQHTPVTNAMAKIGANVAIPAAIGTAALPVVGPIAGMLGGMGAAAGLGTAAGIAMGIKKGIAKGFVEGAENRLKSGIGNIPYYLERNKGLTTATAGQGARELAKQLLMQRGAQQVEERGKKGTVEGAAEHQKQMATNPAYREAMKSGEE